MIPRSLHNWSKTDMRIGYARGNFRRDKFQPVHARHDCMKNCIVMTIFYESKVLPTSNATCCFALALAI